MRPTKAKAKAIAVSERGLDRVILLAFLMVLAVLALPGCNTISGVGEDVSAAGQALDQTSERTQDDLSSDEETPSRDYQAGRY